jgi:hypothetical protein
MRKWDLDPAAAGQTLKRAGYIWSFRTRPNIGWAIAVASSGFLENLRNMTVRSKTFQAGADPHTMRGGYRWAIGKRKS